ncbi:MAG: glycosyltransferase family 4 protein [Patescibacteria group bacterium]
MKKRLKIGLFLASDPSKAGGIQAFVSNVSKELALLQQDVVVFGPQVSHPHVYEFPSYVPVSKSLFLNFPSGFQPRVNLPLLNTSDYKLDILHIHEPYVPFVTGKLPFTKHATVKIAGFHTGWRSTGLWVNTVTATLPHLKHLYHHYYDGVTYASSFVRKNWHVLFESTVSEKIIRYGIRPPKVLGQKSSNGKVNVVFLARLVPRKGVIDFLQAIHLLNPKVFQKIEVTIIGDGPERKIAEMFAQENIHLRKVKFTGELVGEDRLSHLATCDVFVAPYRDEGFGLTIFEALSNGCAITGYMNEVFKDTLDGYPEPSLFVSQGNLKALSKNIEQLVSDKKLREKLSTWGIVQSKKYSWRTVAEQTLQFYRDILESKGISG